MKSATLAKIILVVAVTLNGFAVWHSFQSGKQWNPLGAYSSPQKVMNKNHEVPINGKLHVTFTKCAKDSTVTVVVSASFIEVGNSDHTIVNIASSIPSIRYQSCGSGPKKGSFDSKIPLPKELKEKALAGFRTWKLTGTETPVETNKTGVPREWETEVFKVVGS